MQCRVVKSFRSRGETVHQGAIITVSPNQLPKLSGFVEPLAADSYQDRTQCRYWQQVCHWCETYQASCTGTGDSQCETFRFLEQNTRSDSKGGLA